jgi:hypothetical protein
MGLDGTLERKGAWLKIGPIFPVVTGDYHIIPGQIEPPFLSLLWPGGLLLSFLRWGEPTVTQ